jgi:hypothetical protein
MSEVRFCTCARQSLSEDVIELLTQERKAKENPRLQELRRLLGDPSVSIERLQQEFLPRRPTPSATIEAIMRSVRERGVVALKESANLRRLSGCDAATKAEIDKRISALKKSGRIQ